MSEKPLLVVDAGHGMWNRGFGVFDPGEVFRHPDNPKENVAEVEIVWDWYKTLKFVASSGLSTEYRVVGTRQEFMTPLPLKQRPIVAEKLGGDKFLSIHVNAGGGRGCEVFYSLESDKQWAQEVLDACLAATGFLNRGLKKKGLAVLRHDKWHGFPGPSCLLEIGFGDNEEELEVMLDRNIRWAFAEELLGVWR